MVLGLMTVFSFILLTWLISSRSQLIDRYGGSATPKDRVLITAFSQFKPIEYSIKNLDPIIGDYLDASTAPVDTVEIKLQSTLPEPPLSATVMYDSTKPRDDLNVRYAYKYTYDQGVLTVEAYINPKDLATDQKGSILLVLITAMVQHSFNSRNLSTNSAIIEAHEVFKSNYDFLLSL